MPAPAFSRTVEPAELRVLATGLAFPEGQWPWRTGRVVVAEIAAGRVTASSPTAPPPRWRRPEAAPTASPSVPTGRCTSRTTGGAWEWREVVDSHLPGLAAARVVARAGSLQRIDPRPWRVHQADRRMRGQTAARPQLTSCSTPAAASWFTDHGVRVDRTSDRTGFYWCGADGSGIVEVAMLRRLQRHRPVARRLPRVTSPRPHRPPVGLGRRRSGPGVGAGIMAPKGGELVGDPGGGAPFDSLAVDGEGWICVATLGASGSPPSARRLRDASTTIRPIRSPRTSASVARTVARLRDAVRHRPAGRLRLAPQGGALQHAYSPLMSRAKLRQPPAGRVGGDEFARASGPLTIM